MSTIEDIYRHPVVAVIRHSKAETIVPLVRALKQGGIHSIELTAETRGITAIIEKVRTEFEDEVLVGGGTVLDPQTAKEVIAAGAEFVVSPTLNTETIKTTKRYGKLAIPGGLTPTEILTAYEHGADMVKVFPAASVGPGHIKAIHGPLPQIPLMVTGGITLDNMKAFKDAGSAVFGVGSSLADPRILNTEEDFRKLTERSKAYVEKIQ